MYHQSCSKLILFLLFSSSCRISHWIDLSILLKIILIYEQIRLAQSTSLPPLFPLWLIIMILEHSLLYSFEQAVHAQVLLNSTWENENLCHSSPLPGDWVWSVSGVSCMEIYDDNHMIETINHLKILFLDFLGPIYFIKWQNKFSLQLSLLVIFQFQSWGVYNYFVIYPW